MAYTFAAISKLADTDDQTWYPRLVEKDGRFEAESGETVLTSFEASGMTIWRGGVKPKDRIFSVGKVKIAITVTDTRIVAVCRKFDKGGGWYGDPVSMIVLNGLSKARAAVRSHGRFLVGQMRLRWIARAGYQARQGWRGRNAVRLVATDEDKTPAIVEFSLPSGADPRTMAMAIVDAAAVVHRGEPQRLSDEQLALLQAGLELPEYEPRSDSLAMVEIPGHLTVSGASAHPPTATASVAGARA